MRKIYLDYNATTPLDPRVLEEMIPNMREDYGNPSSIHSFGRRGKAALDRSREQVADLLGAEPREILFTAGGSESNNFAIKGVASRLKERGNHLITTRVEHESVLETYKYLETQGFRVTFLGVDKYGLIDLHELRDSITDKTILVSCIFANNETGTVMPIEAISEIVKKRGAIFHTDAVQAAGKLNIDLERIPADLLSLSAHKIYGPKGAGALFIRNAGQNLEMPLQPLIHGGRQERGRRAGTENVPGVVGLGKACEIAVQDLELRDSECGIKELRDELESGIFNQINGVKLNCHPENRLPNTLNVSFEGVPGDSLAMNLDLEGIAVSTGSACSEGTVDPSHVLLAMGLTREEAASSIRFSLGKFTKREDIECVLNVIPRLVERIRSVKQSAQVKSDEQMVLKKTNAK